VWIATSIERAKKQS
jgi:hypothetical protein